MSRLRAASFYAAAAFALTGCASAGQAWRAGPAGIPAEQVIRGQLSRGEYAVALQSMRNKEIAPADVLLRHMYKGVAALHSGDWEVGTRALDRAWQIAYQRWTKRVGDAAAGMATGEGALPYDPEPAERMFIPYYGALNWLARNERDDAAVEARRLSVLLASDDKNQPADPFLGAMRYIDGVLFESVGEWNDAEVSYRNATALLGGALPLDTVPPGAGEGDVVILIEEGFVARPEPRALDFWVNDDEVNALDGKDDGARLEVFGRVDRRRGERRTWGQDDYRLVSLSWPTMSLEGIDAQRGTLGARAWDGIDYSYAPSLSLDVSAAVYADFQRNQPGRLSRAIARAAVRELALKGAGAAFDAANEARKEKDDDDDDKKKKGSGLGVIGGILIGMVLLVVHSSSAILDQPDLRAWQVLPDRVVVARMRLREGEHEIEVTRDGVAISLGRVTVHGGTVTVLTHRWWPGMPSVVAAATPEP